MYTPKIDGPELRGMMSLEESMDGTAQIKEMNGRRGNISIVQWANVNWTLNLHLRKELWTSVKRT